MSAEPSCKKNGGCNATVQKCIFYLMNELLKEKEKKKGTKNFSILETMTVYSNPIVQSSLQSLLEPCPEGLNIFC